MDNALQPLTSPRWREVERKANELSELYSAPPIPALEIAERSGVDVVFANFGKASDKVAGFCDFAAAKLYVNAEDLTGRQTFTIAHELGHWLLHKHYFDKNPDDYDILPRFQSVDSNDAFEKEANFFAANLLVPKRLLKSVKGASVASLADAFAVSRTMMEYRLKNVR
ncbi:ImmA/IrrE family metallo-endopeptidase [Sphingomonas sp. GM_Shp_1]|uniref:ImmA/IrrE family metallo-endopeptidase n=1 Tax=Sphingomonas sp. GM_Shp_1 TaxID=2937381 RepID=UPI00226B8D28|nr:ImmA/IrrE family metallo-endopeptidase [Sphingomonas sp. GM_Shp_1]